MRSAAALVEMAALIAGGREGDAERLRALRDEALELAERDLRSYALVLEAQRLPRDDPARGARLEEALEQASVDPLEIAEAAGEVAELGVDPAAAANPDPARRRPRGRPDRGERGRRRGGARRDQPEGTPA